MQFSLGRALLGGAAAGVVAAIVNALLYATGVIDQSVATPQGQPITLVPVVLFSLVPNVIGGVVFWAMRNTGRPMRLWTVTVTVVTVVSFVTPFTLSGAPLSMVLALIAMHVVAGAAALIVIPTVCRRDVGPVTTA